MAVYNHGSSRTQKPFNREKDRMKNEESLSMVTVGVPLVFPARLSDCAVDVRLGPPPHEIKIVPCNELEGCHMSDYKTGGSQASRRPAHSKSLCHDRNALAWADTSGHDGTPVLGLCPLASGSSTRPLLRVRAKWNPIGYQDRIDSEVVVAFAASLPRGHTKRHQQCLQTGLAR